MLLLVQFDSTSKNVKQFLIVCWNRIAMTRSNDGTRHSAFLGVLWLASSICWNRKFRAFGANPSEWRQERPFRRKKPAEL
jgi:hypothetical protein